MDQISCQDREDAKYGVKIISLYLTDEEYKMQWGMNIRNAMGKQLKAGKVPTGYRPDWLRKTASDIHELIKKAVMQFETTYTWDKINKMDIFDLIETYKSLYKDEINSF